MTTRQRIQTTYAARLSVACRRHVELNPTRCPHVADIAPATVRAMLMDSMGSDASPYSDDIDAMSSRSWSMLVTSIIRDVETSHGIRRGWLTRKGG